MLLDGHKSARLNFRSIQPDDFETWLPFYEDPESTRYWEGIPTDPVLACKEQFHRIFERYEKNLGGMNALISRTDHVFVGMCGLLLQEIDGKKDWEIGYSLLPRYWGMGYATEAAQYCKKIAFDKGLAESLISIIHINNLPSQHVALRNGMKRGHQTVYKDNPVYIYRICHKI